MSDPMEAIRPLFLAQARLTSALASLEMIPASVLGRDGGAFWARLELVVRELEALRREVGEAQRALARSTGPAGSADSPGVVHGAPPAGSPDLGGIDETA